MFNLIFYCYINNIPPFIFERHSVFRAVLCGSNPALYVYHLSEKKSKEKQKKSKKKRAHKQRKGQPQRDHVPADRVS